MNQATKAIVWFVIVFITMSVIGYMYFSYTSYKNHHEIFSEDGLSLSMNWDNSDGVVINNSEKYFYVVKYQKFGDSGFGSWISSDVTIVQSGETLSVFSIDEGVQIELYNSWGMRIFTQLK